MSYSSLSRYEECPRSYYLGKVRHAEERQTWFFAIGSTVHTAVELRLAGEDPDLKKIFYGLVAEQMKIDPDDVNWLAGGSRDDPVMRAKALGLVERCYENAVAFLEDFAVWEVEYDATGMLPGCEVPIKAYIDVVGEHPKHGPSIVDWKTGKQKPKTALQLETYSALLSQPSISGNDHPFTEHGSLKFTGLWAMLNPESAKARPVDLSNVDASALGARYQAAYEKIQKKIWKASPGFHCRFCVQAPNCLIESPGSRRARFYDRSEQDGYPF